MVNALVSITAKDGSPDTIPHIQAKAPLNFVTLSKRIYESIRAQGFLVTVHKEPYDAHEEHNLLLEKEAAAGAANSGPAVGKAEPKTEPKVEAKVEAEAKAEPKTEPKVEAKVEPKVEAEAKTEAKVEPKVVTEAKTEAKVEPKVEAEAKTEAKVEPKVVTEAKTEAKVEPKVVTGTTEPDTDADDAETEGPVAKATEAEPLGPEDLVNLRDETEALTTLVGAQELIAKWAINFGEDAPTKLKDIKAAVLEMVDEAETSP
jgi:outer membrane biosynthesis protein TonB